MPERTASEVVSDLDIPVFKFDDDDFIVAATLIVTVRDAQDRTGVHMKHSKSLTWLDRIGLLTFCADVEREDGVRMALDRDED